jgi:hypothetical protein
MERKNIMNNLKNTVTNIVGIVVGVGTVVATALRHVPADAKWYVWAGAAALAIVAYFTGKGADGKKVQY